jgi:hypothetical protein
MIVDTSNEIGGDGDIPHPGIGGARRLQVPNSDMQHKACLMFSLIFIRKFVIFHANFHKNTMCSDPSTICTSYLCITFIYLRI